MPNPEDIQKFRSNQNQRSWEEVIPILTQFDDEFDEEIELNRMIENNIIELDEAELHRINTLMDEPDH